MISFFPLHTYLKSWQIIRFEDKIWELLEMLIRLVGTLHEGCLIRSSIFTLWVMLATHNQQ